MKTQTIITIRLTKEDSGLVMMGYDIDVNGEKTTSIPFTYYEMIGVLETIKIDLYKASKVRARKLSKEVAAKNGL